MSESLEVQPFVAGAFQRAVIQVQRVDVHDRLGRAWPKSAVPIPPSAAAELFIDPTYALAMCRFGDSAFELAIGSAYLGWTLAALSAAVRVRLSVAGTQWLCHRLPSRVLAETTRVPLYGHEEIDSATSATAEMNARPRSAGRCSNQRSASPSCRLPEPSGGRHRVVHGFGTHTVRIVKQKSWRL